METKPTTPEAIRIKPMNIRVAVVTVVGTAPMMWTKFTSKH